MINNVTCCLGPADFEALSTQRSPLHTNIRETGHQRVLPQPRTVPHQDQTSQNQLPPVSREPQVKVCLNICFLFSFFSYLLSCLNPGEFINLSSPPLDRVATTKWISNFMICWNKSWTSSRPRPQLWSQTPLKYLKTPTRNHWVKWVKR